METKERKQILSFIVCHKEKERHYFKWTGGMIWILVKYKLCLGMDITFTVSKACDREEYRVRFFAE